ncbi:vinculin-like isoform X3 [Gigantopelta aegis]|uniref:vinculin-like isoform X3 n=1 Tax=Gigantopelta aegis TaxID=1735272 RepID=UPI001B88B4D8|nr:vinculin-like isoform X3 [Gigantopelta aegis]
MLVYLLKTYGINSFLQQQAWPVMGALSAAVTAASFGLLMVYNKDKGIHAITNKASCRKQKIDIQNLKRWRKYYYRILIETVQEVSRLVILHEEAEDGNAMPDLAQPVRVVKLAVDNLVRVGYDTINSSEDHILKQDMPPALVRVEESSMFLIQASDLLRSDPFSGPARKKLIEGSRGILQGTSALLLAFDESEVRKIIRVCKNVLEYLAITEVVDRMEDLVTFVKNLSPVLTKMTKEVDNREKELTHQVHRDMLIRSLEQVKNYTPVLISGVKIYITAKQAGGQAIVDAQSNRDYIVRKMSDEIHEIIRVLQLTVYDEEEWDADDLTVMKKCQNTMEGKMQQAQDWLADTSALIGSAGDKALRQVIEDAKKIGERCSNPGERDAILKKVGDVESMVNALSELRSQGKGNSPQAMSLAREIQGKLRELKTMTQNAIMNTERSGIRKPAPTVEGKVEQARQWLANPGLDDKGLGETATRMVVAEGRRVAQNCQGPARQELLRLCDETEIQTNQLADLCKRGQGNTPQAKAVARHLSEKIDALKMKIEEALVSQVADDFLDVSTPLKQLSEAAVVPLGTPGREANFTEKCRNFAAHAANVADTANLVATAGGCRNKKTVQAIFSNSAQVNDLTPQLVHAAKVVFSNPNNPAALEHFDLLKKHWTDNIERLRNLVDEAVDSSALIRAEEEGIIRDTEKIENGIRMNDSPQIVTNASNIARRANRVLQVAHNEADNSEDPQFVDRVNSASENLKATITPMVQNAKAVSMNPRDSNAGTNWRKANQSLITAVGGVRTAVTVQAKDSYYGQGDRFPEPPDMRQLHISAPLCFADCVPVHHESPIHEISSVYHAQPHQVLCSPYTLVVDSDVGRSVLARVPDEYSANGPMCNQQEEGAPPRPPLPHEMAPPRPPPPETDDEDDFPIPQANQPIMMAAHALHMEAKQWSSKDNEIISAAKRMALLMAKLSQLVRGEGGTKKDLIATAKAIAESSEEVTRLAKKLASDCTDKKMRTNLLQVCERIPTIGTQLKILSTVKATMLGAQEPVPSPDGSEIACGSEEDQEATEMLVGNAQNLMQAVKETVRAAEAASIKIRIDAGYTIRWMRKRPWYT